MWNFAILYLFSCEMLSCVKNGRAGSSATNRFAGNKSVEKCLVFPLIGYRIISFCLQKIIPVVIFDPAWLFVSLFFWKSGDHHWNWAVCTTFVQSGYMVCQFINCLYCTPQRVHHFQSVKICFTLTVLRLRNLLLFFLPASSKIRTLWCPSVFSIVFM
jgi:hypothetical protein